MFDSRIVALSFSQICTAKTIADKSRPGKLEINRKTAAACMLPQQSKSFREHLFTWISNPKNLLQET